HHLGARARVERKDLDRRVVHLGKGRDGELGVRSEPHEEEPRHEQRGRDRPQDEGPGRAHFFWPSRVPTSTFVPSWSWSCPSTTTVSRSCPPAVVPEAPPLLRATVTGRTCATASLSTT